MNRYRVVFSENADRQLGSIWRFISDGSDDDTAEVFTEALIERCLSLDIFPHRGTPRGDLRIGLRTVPFRRKVTIGYVVDGDDVVIVVIAYRGQDLARLLATDEPQPAAVVGTSRRIGTGGAIEDVGLEDYH